MPPRAEQAARAGMPEMRPNAVNGLCFFADFYCDRVFVFISVQICPIYITEAALAALWPGRCRFIRQRRPHCMIGPVCWNISTEPGTLRDCGIQQCARAVYQLNFTGRAVAPVLQNLPDEAAAPRPEGLLKLFWTLLISV
jgi:hypothetical protein